MFLLHSLLVSLLAMLGGDYAQGEPSRQNKDDKHIRLGKVTPGAKVERVVEYHNPFDRPLALHTIQLTPPLSARNITPEVPPGGVGQFTLVMEDDRTFGPFEGVVRINFHNTRESLEFTVDALILPPVEFRPYPAFFVATEQGQPEQATVEIINHQAQPLLISGATHQSDRFKLEVETLEPGKRYEVTLTLSAEYVGEKRSEPIYLLTGEDQRKKMKLQANTWIRESVYTYPEKLDMGRLPVHVTHSQEHLEALAQTLMVYKKGSSDFDIDVSTDLDYLDIQVEKGPDGDRFELTVFLKADQIKLGEISGEIHISTNDPEVPVLRVPVEGSVFDRRG